MLNRTKLINDTIYKHIECSEFESLLLQTKIVNRLFFITQNALAYFAYPSINTKRYIHSLGTMHMSGHMFKNAILNAKENVKYSFLKKLKKSIKVLIKEHKLNLTIKDIDNLSDKTLYEFMIPLKSNNYKDIYLVALQALRIVGLLHDVGHFPFSHQVEYAMEKLYNILKENPTHNEKEKEFLNFYEKTTKNSTLVLHEAIGEKLVKLLFEHEMQQFSTNEKDKNYTKLIYLIVKNILNEKDDGIFDYSVLHKFIDGTVDADRLDYINRDMLASGYIGGSIDFIRIAKRAILIEYKKQFKISFFDSELIDIEHMIEMRFNLYKKIIYNHKISVIDSLLENVILYQAKKYLKSPKNDNDEQTNSISMLWKFLDEENSEKKLDIISQLDENWIITLFKKEYFTIKYKENYNFKDKKYLSSFEEILFGKKFYNSAWRNLNDLYNLLDFSDIQRYKFRESFGYVSKNNYKKLQEKLETLCKKYEDIDGDTFYTYRIVSLNIGIDKEFCLFDGDELIKIDQVSTLRKRLKKSILNTVPFYIFSNKSKLKINMKNEIKEILYDVFL